MEINVPRVLLHPPAPSEDEPIKPPFKDTKIDGKASWKSELGQTRAHWPCCAHSYLLRAITKEFKLPPDQFIRSTRLREWARRNKNSKYIPEALLEAWGFEIESTL